MSGDIKTVCVQCKRYMRLEPTSREMNSAACGWTTAGVDEEHWDEYQEWVKWATDNLRVVKFPYGEFFAPPGSAELPDGGWICGSCNHQAQGTNQPGFGSAPSFDVWQLRNLL